VGALLSGEAEEACFGLPSLGRRLLILLVGIRDTVIFNGAFNYLPTVTVVPAHVLVGSVVNESGSLMHDLGNIASSTFLEVIQLSND
jgi:hypothetical protein